ncbi:MAG: ATP-binding protein [Gaiellales bacterium]
MAETVDHHRLPASAVSVRQAREIVRSAAAKAGVDPRQSTDIALAVTEAAANVVRHAPGGTQGEFDLCVSCENGELVVVVRDYGDGMQADRASSNPGLGIGLRLIQSLPASCVLEKCDPGTRVTMRFARRSRVDGYAHHQPGLFTSANLMAPS